MRLSLKVVIGLLLVATPLVRAPARERADSPVTTWIVLANLATERGGDTTTRNRLQARLGDFVERVRGRQPGNLPPHPMLRVERMSEDLDQMSNRRWNPNVIAMLWGDVAGDQQRVRATAHIDIGRSRALSVLNAHSNRFHPAVAFVSLVDVNEERNELGVYEAVIGYALLVRAWETQPAMVVPIRDTLNETLIAASRGGATGRSNCLSAIRTGMNEIAQKAAGGRRPTANTLAQPREVLARCQ